MKKGSVIAAIFILVILGTALAEEPANENLVVVGTETSGQGGAAAANGTCTVQGSQGACTPQNNILTAAYGKVVSFGGWIVSRDYGSVASNAWRWLTGLSLGIKIVIVLVILFILFLIWNNNFRNTRVNNLKKARAHHLKGEEAHRNGDEEKAREHYEKAREYRERAQDQW